MKKITLIATAVAMAVSGSAFAAGHAKSSVYGKMQLNLESNEDLHMSSGKLVIGFKGSEDLGNGMTLGYHLEMEHDGADAESSTKVWSNDKSNLSLSGGFGKITLGRAGAYRNMACMTDIAKYDADAACDATGIATAANDMLGYTNSFGAIKIGAAITFDGNGAGGAGSGNSDTHLAIQYAAGPLKVGFSTQSGDSVQGAKDATIIGASYKVGAATIVASLGDNGASANNDATDLGVIFGISKASRVYGVVSSGDAVADTTTLGFHKSMSKRTFMKVEMQDVDGAANTKVRATLGHNF